MTWGRCTGGNIWGGHGPQNLFHDVLLLYVHVPYNYTTDITWCLLQIKVAACHF